MLSSLLSSNEKCLGTIIDLLIYSFEINPFFLRNIIKLVNTNYCCPLKLFEPKN